MAGWVDGWWVHGSVGGKGEWMYLLSGSETQTPAPYLVATEQLFYI